MCNEILRQVVRMENDEKKAVVAVYKKTNAALHRIVSNMAEELEGFQKSGKLNEEQQARWDFMFGRRETVLSSAVKLTTISSKLILTEYKTMKKTNSEIEKKIEELSEDDMEIIKRYLQKVKDSGVEDLLELEEKVESGG